MSQVSGLRDYDSGKRVKGRKHYILLRRVSTLAKEYGLSLCLLDSLILRWGSYCLPRCDGRVVNALLF